MEKEFEEYMRISLKEFFRNRIDEMARSRFKGFYQDKDDNLRDSKDIKGILDKLNKELDSVVNLYIKELKKEGLITPDKIKNSPKKVDEITKSAEKQLVSTLEEIK